MRIKWLKNVELVVSNLNDEPWGREFKAQSFCDIEKIKPNEDGTVDLEQTADGDCECMIFNVPRDCFVVVE